MEDLLNSCLFGMYFRPDLELVEEIKLDEDSEAETNKCCGQRNFGDPSEMVAFQVDEPALPFAAEPRCWNMDFFKDDFSSRKRKLWWVGGVPSILGGAAFCIERYWDISLWCFEVCEKKKGLLTFGTLHVWTHRPWTPVGQETSKPRLCLTCLLKGRLLSDEHGPNRDMRCRTTTLLVGTFFLGGNFVMKIWKEGEEFNHIQSKMAFFVT